MLTEKWKIAINHIQFTMNSNDLPPFHHSNRPKYLEKKKIKHTMNSRDSYGNSKRWKNRGRIETKCRRRSFGFPPNANQNYPKTTEYSALRRAKAVHSIAIQPSRNSRRRDLRTKPSTNRTTTPSRLIENLSIRRSTLSTHTEPPAGNSIPLAMHSRNPRPSECVSFRRPNHPKCSATQSLRRATR